MLESVLMRAFMMLYVRDHGGDDDRLPYMSGKSRSAERRAFNLLALVSSCWRYTLTGWPKSPTKDWVKHQLNKLIKCEYIFC